MVGVANEKDYIDLLSAGLDNRTYGCFKNGSGETLVGPLHTSVFKDMQS